VSSPLPDASMSQESKQATNTKSAETIERSKRAPLALSRRRRLLLLLRLRLPASFLVFACVLLTNRLLFY
jgi:hypothetical protein